MNDKELLKIIDAAAKDFSGICTEMETAIGALVFGRHVGWKPLLLMHDKKTLRKYEKILGIEFRDVLPEVGELSDKSVAWKLAQKASNFWKAVSGHIPGIRTNQVEKLK
ncbi:MAG TPA: hypothetical protein VFT64_01220 [Rickettsiales bacterium]|nr:hypothetical protein [Rickettsiales bacterium]